MNRRKVLQILAGTVGVVGVASISAKAAEINPLNGRKLAAFLGTYPFTLPAIAGGDIMAPAVSAANTLLHHDVHHQAYVNGLNATIAKLPELQTANLGDILRINDGFAPGVKEDLAFFGGGHLNHSLFWRAFTGRRDMPSTELFNAIGTAFGSINKLEDELSKAAGAFRGSGWVWLIRSGKSLEIMTTNLQDNPLQFGRRPILGIDLWEHAYYPTHQNRRGDYVRALINQINWTEVDRAWASYN